MPTLLLRRANISRKGGPWQHDDYDVFDGTAGADVGRIFQRADGSWFWGVSFQLTRRKSYGSAASLDEAKAAFRAEYERAASSAPTRPNWKDWQERPTLTFPHMREI
jgi:hypothetical protein